MITAYTLVRVEPQKNIDVFNELKKLPLIKEATLVYGEYDVVLKTITRSVTELNKLVYEVLRKTPNIAMTTTMIVARMPNPSKSSAGHNDQHQ